MPKPFVRAALATFVLCAALPVLAQFNQQAQITSVKVTLVDLDLSDGITPAISFADGGFVGTWIPAPVGSVDLMQWPVPLGMSATFSRSIGPHTVTFTMLSGELLGAGLGPGALATHEGVGPGGLAGEAQVIFSDFSLTPNTRIELSAFASASTAGYTGSGSDFSAWAGAGVNLFSRELQTSLAADFVNTFVNQLGDGTHSEARFVFAAYDNHSTQPLSASISAVAYLGASEVGAVPEPGSWALLAGGLVALALRRRR